MNNNINAEEYVTEHREEILTLIRRSSDPFTRAAAWTLLDKYTPDNDYEQLEAELQVLFRGESS